MATEAFMTAESGRLVPVSASDQEVIRSLPRGKTFTVVIKQRRSTKQDRYYWSMLNLVVKATGRWPNSATLHRAIKMQMGLFEPLVQPNGTIRLMEGSTSHGAMGGLEFSEYLNAAIDIILTDILAGTKRSAFLDEIEKMAGVSYSELGGEA